MVNILLKQSALHEIDAQAYAVVLEHGFKIEQLSQISKFYPPLEQIIMSRNFTAGKGSSLLVTGVKEGKGVAIILLGLGDLKSDIHNVETYRRALGRLVRIVEYNKIPSIALELPDPGRLNLSYNRLAQETASIMLKASYHFDQFITSSARKLSTNFDLLISSNSINHTEIEEGVKQGVIIGQAINRARYWCDMPPSQLTPAILADQAKELAKCYGLDIKIFDEKKIKDLGMGGIVAVSQGSVEEARLIFLEYKTSKKDAPTVAIVGKGITFDSGGLSLKPAKAMETMKDDMAGASIVLSTMQVIAQFKPDVNVLAVAALAENMPSGSAIKPGDIVTFYNGKTAEIKNTDAEGRLVLADALAYTVEQYKPAAIIDLATLTGACAHALGPFYAGLFSDHDGFVDKLMVASKHSGDRVWRLPMHEDYAAAIRSDVADLCNAGNPSYLSGATTAALFLQNFVSNTPWAHLDIAGVAFGVPDMCYYRPGATGFGIRLLVDLLMHWQID